MSLGDLQRTRRLAGNPATGNVSDADITQYLLYGTAEVVSITGKTDWETDTLNPLYPACVAAAEYFAASMIRDRFSDQTDISTEIYNRAKDLLMQVAESLATGGGGGAGSSSALQAIAVRQYRTNPLNPNARVYKSSSNTGTELIGVGDYDIPR